ncbi:MAG: hypothetical protein C5B53_01090 [Candidatus Melainabacteria bacterium]|nr:MAG: hypothetical protein C5B53_01090 [Candidatus Melainabacteria bacterium]
MPASRDDSSGASAQNQRRDSNAGNVDKQQPQLKSEPPVKQGEADAGKAAPGMEEMGATEAAFHKAIGLDKVPLKGMVEITVKRVEMEAQRAEGVSRAQNVCFTNGRGENIVGTQYSNEGGTFLKTSSGQKFSVNIEPAGNFVLSSLAQPDFNFTAVKLTVLSDQFGTSVDNRLLSEISTIAANVSRNIQAAEVVSAAAALEQGAGKGKQLDDSATPSLKSQEITARETSQSAASDPFAEMIAASRRTSDVPASTTTDQTKSAAVAASSLDAISGLIAGLATPAEAVIQYPEVKTTEEEGTLPAPPLAFDLAEIVEPTLKVVRSAKAKESEVEEAEAPSAKTTPSTTAGDDLDEEETRVQAEAELSEDEEAIRERINKAKQDRRRRYIVKDKDTLSSIAAKQLKDRRLGELIFEINKHLIPVKVVRGRPVRQLKSRMVIFLPTQVEVDEYRTRLGSAFGESAEMADEMSESEADQELVSIVGVKSSAPKVERQEYTVRLGDTLKTIAMKHPALSDIGLWLLLAEVNGLATEVDERGQPLAKLMRGNRLAIPTAAEIERFSKENLGGDKKKRK